LSFYSPTRLLHIDYFLEYLDHNDLSLAQTLRGGNDVMMDDDIEDPDDVDEAGSVIDSAHELIDDASLVNNLPVEEANFPIQAALNGHNASQRRTNLQQQLATNPIGAQYNMDALLPQRNVERHDMGTMSVTCSYCNATGFAKERKNKRIGVLILDDFVVMEGLQCSTIFLLFLTIL
jgi:hypothetical protein